MQFCIVYELVKFQSISVVIEKSDISVIASPSGLKIACIVHFGVFVVRLLPSTRHSAVAGRGYVGVARMCPGQMKLSVGGKWV